MSSTGRHVSRLSGYAPALPTPLDDEGCIDAVAFERLCDLQVAHGATALVVCGTTGEAPTLSSQEHDDLIRIAVARSRADGYRSLPEQVRMRPRIRSHWPRVRKPPVQTRFYRWCRTTTNLHRKGFIAISARSR